MCKKINNLYGLSNTILKKLNLNFLHLNLKIKKNNKKYNKNEKMSNM